MAKNIRRRKVVKTWGFWKTLVVIIALALAAISLLCMTAPFYSWTATGGSGDNTFTAGFSFSGFTLAWGGSAIGEYEGIGIFEGLSGSDSTEVSTQNGGLIAMFALLLIGILFLIIYLVLSFVPSVGRYPLVSKGLPVLTFLVLLTGGILAFCALPMTKSQIDMSDVAESISKVPGMKSSENIGIGAIMSGITGIISSIVSVCLVPMTK